MVAEGIVMARVTTRVGVVVALMAAVLGGWLWGASGRWEIDRALRAGALRNDVAEARAAVLDARASLFDGDYGGTSRHLANARQFIGRACGQLDAVGTCEDLLPPLDLGRLSAEIDRARRLAASLEAGVGTGAGAQ
jgi:hypothetical protein